MAAERLLRYLTGDPLVARFCGLARLPTPSASRRLRIRAVATGARGPAAGSSPRPTILEELAVLDGKQAVHLEQIVVAFAIGRALEVERNLADGLIAAPVTR